MSIIFVKLNLQKTVFKANFFFLEPMTLCCTYPGWVGNTVVNDKEIHQFWKDNLFLVNSTLNKILMSWWASSLSNWNCRKPFLGLTFFHLFCLVMLKLNTGNFENSTIGINQPSKAFHPSRAYQAPRYYLSYKSIETGEPFSSRAYPVGYHKAIYYRDGGTEGLGQAASPKFCWGHR